MLTAMTDQRTVSLSRLEHGRYAATNVRGTTLTFGHGQTDEFTPVELLLVAIAGCTAVDVDFLTSRRAEPTSFEVTSTGRKIRDEAGGNRMTDLEVTFRVTFPAGPDGDRAREMLPRALELAHDRLCTVSRTVELGSPVTTISASGTSHPPQDDGTSETP